MADGTTSFSVSREGDPYDQLLAQVREAAAGAYDVLGELGRSKRGNVVYLAREIETGHLVAMKLSRESAETNEFSLEVVRTLDASVPGLESQCPECKAVLPDWDRFCFRCGADLASTGYEAQRGPTDEAALLEAVKEATAGTYEILGKMDRADGGGPVFFARDLSRDKLVALRLKREDSGDPSQVGYSIGETQVFRPLVAELGATQVAPAGFGLLDLPSAPSETPEPPPPPIPPTPVAEVPVMTAGAGAESRTARKPSRKLLLGGIGAVALLLIVVLAFQGGDDPPAPAPVPVPPPAEPAPVPPPAEPDPTPDDPVEAATDPVTVDSGTVVVGVPLPPGGRLTVNGRAVRGAQLRLPAGSHALALTAAGYEAVQERITVRAGQTVTWRPRLVAVVAAQPAPAPPAAPAPAPPPPAATATCARAAGRSEWTVALELCRKEATAGDAVAQRLLARMFDDGTGTAQDRAEAAQWYARAAGGGDRESQERLGYLYRDGLGVKKDERQSAAYFKEAAEGGRVAAQLEYGVALDEGKGVSENDREAASWYEKAAGAGNAPAARRLARLYERGDGVAKSEAEAARWYRVAAERGDRDAQYQLGRFYKDGKGVEKSPTEALEWFRKAAAQGHRDAQNEARKLEKS